MSEDIKGNTKDKGLKLNLEKNIKYVICITANIAYIKAMLDVIIFLSAYLVAE